MAEHRYEIGEIPDSQMVSASCACGWSFVQGYARPTGRPVAVRLALLRFGQHAELAAERDNLLGEPVRALCLSRPAEWWDLDNDGCRLALALCRVCPAIDACTTQSRRPVGVVQAGVAYSDAGVPLPLCHCGYPNELDGCCHRCGVTTLAGVPRRIYWATRYRQQKSAVAV